MDAADFKTTVTISADDQTDAGFTAAEQRATAFEKHYQQTHGRLKNLTASPSITLADKATPSLGKIRDVLTETTKKAWEIPVSIKDHATEGIRKIFDTLTNPLVMLGLIGGGALSFEGMVKAPLDMANNLENAQHALGNVMGSASLAADQVERLSTYARQTGESNVMFTDMTKSMLAMGFSTGQAAEALQAATNAAHAFNLGSGGIQTITDEFVRMQNTIFFSNRELQQLQNMGVNALQIIADATGKSTAQVLLAVRGGGVLSSKVLPYLVNYMAHDLPQATDVATMTLDQMFGVVQNTFDQTIIESWGKGLQEAAIPAIQGLTKWIGTNDAAMGIWRKTIQDTSREIGTFVLDKLGTLAKALTAVAQTDKFQNATIGGKIGIIWNDVVVKSWNDWLAAGGATWIKQAAKDIGSGLGDAGHGALLAMFGVNTGDTASVGAQAGHAFVSGFMDQLTKDDLKGQIAKQLVNMQPGADVGNVHVGGQASVAGGILNDVLLATVATTVGGVLLRSPLGQIARAGAGGLAGLWRLTGAGGAGAAAAAEGVGTAAAGGAAEAGAASDAALMAAARAWAAGGAAAPELVTGVGAEGTVAAAGAPLAPSVGAAALAAAAFASVVALLNPDSLKLVWGATGFDPWSGMLPKEGQSTASWMATLPNAMGDLNTQAAHAARSLDLLTVAANTNVDAQARATDSLINAGGGAGSTPYGPANPNVNAQASSSYIPSATSGTSGGLGLPPGDQPPPSVGATGSAYAAATDTNPAAGDIPGWRQVLQSQAPKDLQNNPQFINTVLAGAYAESGLDPKRVQQGGGGRGFFQFDLGGMGAGLTNAQLFSEQYQASQIMQLYADAWRRAPVGLSPAQKAAWVAVQAERPDDRLGQATRNYTAAYGAVSTHYAGGTIYEPVMGVGQSTGRRYSFGERGAETVTPGAGGRSGPSVTIAPGAIVIQAGIGSKPAEVVAALSGALDALANEFARRLEQSSANAI